MSDLEIMSKIDQSDVWHLTDAAYCCCCCEDEGDGEEDDAVAWLIFVWLILKCCWREKPILFSFLGFFVRMWLLPGRQSRQLFSCGHTHSVSKGFKPTVSEDPRQLHICGPHKYVLSHTCTCMPTRQMPYPSGTHFCKEISGLSGQTPAVPAHTAGGDILPVPYEVLLHLPLSKHKPVPPESSSSVMHVCCYHHPIFLCLPLATIFTK